MPIPFLPGQIRPPHFHPPPCSAPPPCCSEQASPSPAGATPANKRGKALGCLPAELDNALSPHALWHRCDSLRSWNMRSSGTGHTTGLSHKSIHESVDFPSTWLPKLWMPRPRMATQALLAGPLCPLVALSCWPKVAEPPRALGISAPAQTPWNQTCLDAGAERISEILTWRCGSEMIPALFELKSATRILFPGGEKRAGGGGEGGHEWQRAKVSTEGA